MKKIFGIMWVVLIYCLLSSTICFADTDVTIQEQVLMDENNICITATGFKDASTSYMLYLQIENNTDEKITVYATRTSINGIMIDGTIAKDVEPHDTVNAAIDFLDFLLNDAGISQIGEIETGFHVIGKNIDFETIPATIKTSLYGTFTQDYDDSGEVFFDEKGIRLIKKDLSVNEFVTGQDFYIDNASGKRIQIIATENKVNGTSINSTLTFPAVEVDKKATESLSFMKSDLDKAGINKINSLSSHFTFYDADTQEMLAEKDVNFEQESQGMIAALNLKDEAAYSDEYIQIKASNMQIDNLGITTLDLSIKNMSNETIRYSGGKIQVNGKEVSGSVGTFGNPDFLVEVKSGEEHLTVLRIERDGLAKQGITEISSIELELGIIIGYSKTYDAIINIPFDNDSSASTNVPSDLSKVADDYIANTYFIQSADSLSVLYELKNTNNTTVSLHGTLSFKDADGNVIDIKEDYINYISPDCYNFMIFTTKESAETVSISLTPSIFTDKAASLSYDVDDSLKNTLKIKVTNNGDTISSNTDLTVVFVKNGKINGFSEYSKDLSGKETTDINPHDSLESTLSDISYDDYYIYLTGVAK